LIESKDLLIMAWSPKLPPRHTDNCPADVADRCGTMQEDFWSQSTKNQQNQKYKCIFRAWKYLSGV